MSASTLTLPTPTRRARARARMRASDPGNLRLHLASSLVLSAAASALACWIVARATGQIEVVVGQPSSAGGPITAVVHPLAVLIGVQPAMFMASVPLPTSTRSRLVMMVLAAPLLLIGFGLGVMIGSTEWLGTASLCLIVTAMVLAQRVPKIVPLGLPLLYGTFLAIFMEIHARQLPWTALMIGVGTTVAIGVHLMLFWPRPARTLHRIRTAFHDQAGIVLDAAIDVLLAPGRSSRNEQRLIRAVNALGETGLVLDAQLASGNVGHDAAFIDRIHQIVFDQEAAYYAVVRGVLDLGQSTATDAARHRAALALAAVRSDDLPRAHRQVADLVSCADVALRVRPAAAGEQRSALLAEYHLAVALHDLDTTASDGADPPSAATFRPTVRTASGALLGSGPSAVMAQRSAAAASTWRGFPPDIWHRAARMLIATSLAVVVGTIVSPIRWYWAFFTAFAVMGAANTAAEHLRVAVDRALGTACGVLVAVVVAHVVAIAPGISFALLFLAAGVAFYVQRPSTVLSTSAMTFMVAQLYQQLHEYTDRLLLTRMAETALGAVIAIGVSLTVFRVRTSHVAATGTSRYLDALEQVICSTTAHLSATRPSTELRGDVRTLQDLYRQLRATVVRPMTLARATRTPRGLALMAAITSDATSIARRCDAAAQLDGPARHDMIEVGAQLLDQVAAIRRSLAGGKGEARGPSVALDALDRDLRRATGSSARAQFAVVRELAVLDEHLIELAESYGAPPAEHEPRREIVRPLPAAFATATG